MNRILVFTLLALLPIAGVAQETPAAPETTEDAPAAPSTAPAPAPETSGTAAPASAPDGPATAQPTAAEPDPEGLTTLLSGILDHYGDMRTSLVTAFEEGAHDEMSPIGMFMAADWVVKGVMISLAFASVLTWAIFAAKLLVLWSRRRALARQYRALDRAGTLRRLPRRLEKSRGIVGRMTRAALSEWEKSGNQPALKPGIKERTASVLSRIEAGAARRMGAGTGILANIGSTAPFVGLFGTVWGIMNSFISISESNTTNLAVVAPGIAEALLATAIGLVAAIPAVIFYNLISRGLGGYKIMLGDAAALVERTLSRDLDLPLPGYGVETAPAFAPVRDAAPTAAE